MWGHRRSLPDDARRTRGERLSWRVGPPSDG